MLVRDVISRKINGTAISQKHSFRYKPAAWAAKFQPWKWSVKPELWLWGLLSLGCVYFKVGCRAQIKIMERRRRIFVTGWKEVIHLHLFNLMSESAFYLCSFWVLQRKIKAHLFPKQFVILPDSLLLMNVLVVCNSDRVSPSAYQKSGLTW